MKNERMLTQPWTPREAQSENTPLDPVISTLSTHLMVTLQRKQRSSTAEVLTKK